MLHSIAKVKNMSCTLSFNGSLSEFPHSFVIKEEPDRERSHGNGNFYFYFIFIIIYYPILLQLVYTAVAALVVGAHGDFSNSNLSRRILPTVVGSSP